MCEPTVHFGYHGWLSLFYNTGRWVACRHMDGTVSQDWEEVTCKRCWQWLVRKEAKNYREIWCLRAEVERLSAALAKADGEEG